MSGNQQRISRIIRKLLKNRIFKFMVGLNVEFDEVRGRIIGRQPLPSIGEVFSEVRREESRRNVVLVLSPKNKWSIFVCC